MAISKEVKVGLLALTAGVVLYIGFNFLKGYEIFSDTKKYYVVYEEIDGLTVSNPVLLNGLTVGRVQNIQLQPEKGNRIVVTLDVDEEVQVGDSTYALLANTDLLGGKSIELEMQNSTRLLEGGDTLPGRKKTEITEALTEAAMPILDNLNSTVAQFNKVFNDEVGQSMQKTVKNFEDASGDLKSMVEANDRNIRAITGNLAQLTGSLKETERSLKPVLDKMASFADSLNDLELKQTVANANAAMENLNQVSRKLQSEEGTLGALINDKELYTQLNRSLVDIRRLMIDLQYNPKKYLGPLGKKPKRDAPVPEMPEYQE